MATIKYGLFVLLYIGYVSAEIEDSHKKPMILYGKQINPKEVIINSNEDLKLTCEGNKEMFWTYPNETVNDNTFSIINIASTHYKLEYRSTLTLMNASFVDTGFFKCHYMDNDASNEIYVFVKDDEHLFASGRSILIVNGVQGKPLTIPCKPTSPDVNVTLWNVEDPTEMLKIPYDAKYGFSLTITTNFNSHYTCKLIGHSKYEEINYTSYDPKVGFVLTLYSVTDSGYYYCTYLHDGYEQQEQIFQIIVHPATEHVPKPYIEAPNKGFVTVGEKLILNCSIRINNDVYFEMNWEVPNKKALKNGRITFQLKHFKYDTHTKVGTILLIIDKVALEDDGDYLCTVSDHDLKNNSALQTIKVQGKGYSYINLTEETNQYLINVTAGENVQWSINYDAYPAVTLTWLDKYRSEINNNSKFDTIQRNMATLLRIKDVRLRDAGVYQLTATNEQQQKVLNLTLIVREKPTVDITNKDYHIYGEVSSVKCSVLGYPLPSIHWEYQPCMDDSCAFIKIPSFNYSVNYTGNQQLDSTLMLTAYKSGYVKCSAMNNEGNDSSTIAFLVTDVDRGFDVWGGYNDGIVAFGDIITLHCAASTHNYTNITWFKDSTIIPLETDDKYLIEHSSTNFSNKVSLTILSLTYNDSGNYICSAKGDAEDNKNMTIVVTESTKPLILNSNMNGTDLFIEIGDPLNMYCYVTGNPKPTVTWTKDNHDWSIGVNHSRIKLMDDNQKLSFQFTHTKDEGVYECHASNRIGTDQRTMTLIFKSTGWVDHTLLVIIILLTIFFIILIAVLIIKIKKEKKLQRELKEMGLANFEKGATENLNPELRIDDQAELLPYDRKWEFPRDKLKLGKQLGSGAFGVVMKAEAVGISDTEPVTTVAVKMVIRNTEMIYIRALASELKIMVHLGKHLNVVNLLGACTKNVIKRELLVIVEYCQYGNLHNYLYRHRDNFINQIDPNTGLIDSSIGAEIIERSLSVGSENQRKLKYAQLSFLNREKPGPACAGVDYRANPTPNNCDTKSPCAPTSGEESLLMSNNSIQPEWRSNYRGDYKGCVKPISSNDLLCWAFQVARGMDYLASRKVLHGDLAARNILLAENNIVKICDFGLAKSMYKSNNYKKKGDGPLPLKWMAIESIRDRVFSTQSDVWSYGIVLWEFFTLACTPYAGMDADEKFYHKLSEGYRMEQPEYATKELYQTMLNCWDAKPMNRPSFTTLVEHLGNMLHESVRMHYVDLNNPYITMNTDVIQKGTSDYLSMFSPPDYGNLSSPHQYVNDGLPIPENPGEASGYLMMKSPVDIFSPREPNNIFDFDVKKPKANDNLASGIELEPMLKSANNVESDTESVSSPTLTSFSNPNYKTKVSSAEPHKDIFKTTDNYINMPQHKIMMKSEEENKTDSFSNPSYVQMKKNEVNSFDNKNYINSQSRDWDQPFV